MTSEIHQKMYEFLRHYPLSLSIEDGTILLQNGRETLGISDFENGNKLKVGYLALDRRVTHETLEGCPETIRDWYDALHSLRDNVKGYVTAAGFSSVFDFDTAVEVCGFMGSKMVTNKRNIEGIVVN